jgi:hypothetical protein
MGNILTVCDDSLLSGPVDLLVKVSCERLGHCPAVGSLTDQILTFYNKGTCPGLSIEQAVKYVERSPVELYPYQAAILITDGVFFDSPAPQKATQGLEAYKAVRFSVGIAVAKNGERLGLNKEEIEVRKL